MTDTTLPDDIIGGLRVPLVLASRDETGECMRFWCRWCNRYHYHGRYPEVGRADGHAVAHCQTDDSPYRITGYHLVEVEHELPLPPKRFKVKYGRDGSLRSGFLAASKAGRR